MAETKENKGILIESGTNEFEMLSFRIGDNTYGVNVSKVKEIIMSQKITPLPGADERILGLTMPRDEVITVVDLRRCLFNESSTVHENSYFIVCHFNKITTAFLVDSVTEIRRYLWSDIIQTDAIMNYDNSMITGVIKTKDAIVGILDFEKIMVDIDINNGFTVKDVENIRQDIINSNRGQNLKILIAEDSRILNKLITDTMEKVGFHYDTFFDGESAYNALVENMRDDSIHHYDAIISDIEMPKMDGMRFCKLVKENADYKKVPFIIFSSLIDEQMEKKCKSVGADGCLSKPEIGNVIEMVQTLIYNPPRKEEEE